LILRGRLENFPSPAKRYRRKVNKKEIMKFRGFVLFLLAATGLLVAAYYPPKVNNAEKEAILMQTILAGLNQLHYHPVELDDEFSGTLHKLYLDRLDGGKRWLTQEDAKQLESFKAQLDDEANAGTYEFLTMAMNIKEKSLDKTEKYFRQILSTPFDFSTSEMVEVDGDKKEYAQNDEELYAYWQKSLKHDVLARLVEKTDAQKKKIKELENPVKKVAEGTGEEKIETEEEEFVIKRNF